MYDVPTSVSEIERLTFVPPHHPVLNRRSREISAEEIRTDTFRALVDRMLAIARGETFENSGVRLVGLAAPQIGVGLRLIVADVAYTGADAKNEPSTLQLFVNPRIVERSTDTNVRREGCYSTGKIHGLVERATRITFEALDRDGSPVSKTVDGFAARVLQHEVDHLDGIRFPDRISNNAHLHWVDSREDMAAYRQGAEAWTRLCSRERWEAMKAGDALQYDP